MPPKRTNPARPPGSMPARSNRAVASPVPVPMIRRLIVLGDFQNPPLATGLDAPSRSQPALSVSDQRLSRGSWFHSHCGLSRGESNSSSAAGAAIGNPSIGLSCTRTGSPMPSPSTSRPIIGQPSSQRTGCSICGRPWNGVLMFWINWCVYHQEPSGAFISAPWLQLRITPLPRS